VFDTNVLVGAFLFDTSIPGHAVMSASQGDMLLFSVTTWAELRAVPLTIGLPEGIRRHGERLSALRLSA
jgi:predicted nucleic acid-binding protein